MADKFPRPYLDSVPKDPENTPQMEYVPFKKMGIGARASGLPKGEVGNLKSIDHVGSDGTKGR